MSDIPPEILDIAERLVRNEKLKHKTVTVDTLLKWFGAERRGHAVVDKIRTVLQSARLETDPDFTQGAVDNRISFRLIKRTLDSGSANCRIGQRQASPGRTETAGNCPSDDGSNARPFR